jgi:hypothetical protein
MTEQKAIEAVVTTANGQVGYREGENNYNKYAAELDPLKLTYGNKQNAPWCGEFVLWVFWKCFGADDALKMLCSPKPTSIPLCSAGAKYFQAAGRWSDKPSVGDVIFYFVDGGINHTGIVTGVSGNTITTVEGHSSDMVSRRRNYGINDSRIAGYGKPKWDVVSKEPQLAQPITPPSDQPVTVRPISVSIKDLPVLRKGNKGDTVKAAQMLLRGWGCDVGIWGVDGDYGNATEAAVLAYQRRHGLVADGIIGQQTWSALLGL